LHIYKINVGCASARDSFLITLVGFYTFTELM